MGGSGSAEFQVLAQSGEDAIAGAVVLEALARRPRDAGLVPTLVALIGVTRA